MADYLEFFSLFGVRCRRVELQVRDIPAVRIFELDESIRDLLIHQLKVTLGSSKNEPRRL
jgi:hypothetical protein